MASNPDGAIAALKTISTEGKRSRKFTATARNGKAAERLGRLRTELGRINPRPETALQAHAAILAAMARANLGDWSIPELDDPSATSYPDGSVQVNLIAHAIIFNPWGAFRIVNLRSNEAIYFELAGADQRVFVEPRECGTR